MPTRTAHASFTSVVNFGVDGRSGRSISTMASPRPPAAMYAYVRAR